MTYRVRLTDLGEARDVFLPIWSTSLHVGARPERELEWFYRDGPHGPGQAFVLQPDDSPTAIGCAGLGVRSLWRGEHALRTGLFADLAVDPSHRTALPALTLVRAVKQHADDQFGLGYGFPNHRAIALYRRAGFRQLGLMQRYARPLRTRGYLEGRLGKPVARLIAPAIDRLVGIAAALVVLEHPRALELHWLDDFDARFDRLWLEARLGYPLLCERTSAFLRWRFSRQVHGRDYRIAALVARDRLRAYAIVHLDDGVAKIVDLFGAGLTDLDALLAHLIAALCRLGCLSITMRFLGAQQIPQLLAAHGFSRRRETRHVMVSFGSAMRDDPELQDPQSWYLTDLDEDR
jgi:RimJ/RimL family protein N-acetyltransferase